MCRGVKALHEMTGLLSTMLCSALLGCSSRDVVAVPEIDPFRTALPGAELGIRLADLATDRPGLGMKGDGTYWEELQELDVLYGFWPKEANRPPPLSARLMAIEGRKQVYDTVGLWSRWQEAVERTTMVLGVRPRCRLLTGVRMTMIRADYAGKVQVSVGGEVWRAEDGQDFDAFLVTWVRLGDFAAFQGAGMENRDVDCRDRHPL
jgi:hypothetical protein